MLGRRALARYRRRRVVMLVGVGLTMALLLVMVWSTGLLRSLENQSVDARFAVRGAQRPKSPVAVVAVDAQTFVDVGRQWPFPRRLHARLIDRLIRAGARVVAFDIQISEPSDTADDNALGDSVRRANGRVVLATTEVSQNGVPNVFGGGDILKVLGARAGNTVLPGDRGGTIRRLPYATDGLESFGIVAAEVASGRRIVRSQSGSSTPWIDYAGPPATFPSYSYSDALAGRISPRKIAGRIVVVGATASSLQDLHATSTTDRALMPGPEVQANAIATALRGFPLRDVADWISVLLIVALAMAPPLFNLRFGARQAPLATLVLAAGYLGAAQVTFDGGRVLPVVNPLLGLLGALVGTIAVHAVTSAFERERVRNLFARFVPEQVVDDVIARSDGLRLGGRRLEGTILFSDLRGFTSYSESLPAEQVIDVLNRYLSEMSDAILDSGGTLTAYMGDGIMALFGGPIEHPDHADRALEAALEMLRRLERFNEWVRRNNYGEGFRMGIGLNSGTVMAGNVGSERRLDYTAIGDTVNTASRLEGMTKGTPHQLFVADSTRTLLKRNHPELLEVGELEVRGRTQRIRVWSTREATDAEMVVLADTGERR